MVEDGGIATRYRRLPVIWQVIAWLLPASSIIAGLIYIFALRPFGFVFLDVGYLYLFAGLFLPVCFIWIPISKGVDKDRVPWYDVILILASFAIPLYYYFNANLIIVQWVHSAPTISIILGGILWIIIIESARRGVGWFFAVFFAVITFYPLFGNLMPGIFHTQNFALPRVIQFHMMSEEAMPGIPLRVTARVFFGFTTYAAVLMTCNVGQFFNDIATALLRSTRGGNAKVAVVSSGLFGSISGAPGANVMTTGAFTIPAMKREGFPPHYAGAVEAVASTGGALMPPIMGAVAFIAAEFIGVPYVNVCIVAVIPSLLYFITLFAQVDAQAARRGIKPTAEVVLAPPIRQTIFNNLHILLGFLLLIYILFFMRLEAWSPWIASAVTVVLAMARKRTRLGLRHLAGFLNILGQIIGGLMGLTCALGMIIGAFVLSGVAFSFPYAMVNMAGGNVYLLLLLGAAASFILGMGVSISACYIFLAIVLVPGLLMGGFDLMAAHLFVLYCGMMSYITPPVAISAVYGSILAGASFMKTALTSMRLGITLFIVPFFFVLNPALILRGSPLETLQAAPTCALGLILISGAFEGYIWRIGNIGFIARILFFISGALIAIPNTSTDLMGAGGVAIATVICLLSKKYRKGK